MIESTDGSMVGDVINERTESVHPDKLRDELLAIGNDGEFFNMEDNRVRDRVAERHAGRSGTRVRPCCRR